MSPLSLFILLIISIQSVLPKENIYVEDLEDATFDDRVQGTIWMIKFYAPYEC